MLISVITVVRNRVDLVRGCIESVRAQQGAAFEHVVIDGASDDGTVEVLRRYQDGFAYWHSARDGGIADAMNQGIAHAQGEWLLFLHADDELAAPDALARVAPVLESSRADVVGFPIHYQCDGTRRLVRPRGATPWLKLKTGFAHQGTFMRRAAFARVGGYDTRLAIAMDYEWFLRARQAGLALVTSDAVVPTLMRDTGISARLDWPSLERRFAEERTVHAWHARGIAERIGYRMYWALYPRYRWLRARMSRRTS